MAMRTMGMARAGVVCSTVLEGNGWRPGFVIFFKRAGILPELSSQQQSMKTSEKMSGLL